MTELTITVDDYPSLKKHFDLAVEEHQKEFVFKDHTLVTEYAKYVLEYLKPLYEKRNTNE